MSIEFKHANVDGLKSLPWAGHPDAPKLLRCRIPSASHMFRT